MITLDIAIADNLRQVRERIANAAVRAGRKPEDVTLVAVSKTKPVEAVKAALAAGQTVFGENRVQEAAEKFPLAGTSLHLIGGLQTNKARDAVRIADVIETSTGPGWPTRFPPRWRRKVAGQSLLIE